MVCLRGGRGPRQRPGVLAAALLTLATLPACLATAGCLTLLAAAATCHAALSQLVPGATR